MIGGACADLIPAPRYCVSISTAQREALAQFSIQFAQSATELNLIIQSRLALQVEATATCANEQGMLASLALASSNASTSWRFNAAAFAHFQAQSALQLSASGGHALTWNVALHGETERAAFETAAATAAASGTLDAPLAARLQLPVAASATAATPTPAPAAPLHLVVWDVAPIASRPIVMFDLLSNGSSAERRAAILQSAASGAAAATDLLLQVYASPPVLSFAPGTIVFVPAYAPADGSSGPAVLVGMCGMSFEWSALVTSALPSFLNSVTAVLTSATGRQATITLTGGTLAAQDEGDTHDRDYDADAHAFTVAVAGSPWTMTLYPTSQLHSLYAATAPPKSTVIVVLLVCCFGGLFSIYEMLVRHRNNVLVAALAANLQQVLVLKNEVERASAEGMRQQDSFVAMVSHEGALRECRLRAHRLTADAAAPRSAHTAERGAGRSHVAAGHCTAQPGAARAALRVGRGRRPRRGHRGRQCVHAACASLPALRGV